MLLRRSLVGVVLVGVLTATFLNPVASARPSGRSTIAVFANGDYVNAQPLDMGGDVANLVEDLEAADHTVRTFTDLSASGFTAALDGADVLLIPEQQVRHDLYDDMTAEAKAVVVDWVRAGGRLVMIYGLDAHYGLNTLFGFDTTLGIRSSSVQAVDTAATTEFADGPPNLLEERFNLGLAGASLPAGTVDVYGTTAGERSSTVGAVPVGDGVVIYLAWDWFPDRGFGEPEPASAEGEADWARVLDLAVSQPEVTATSSPDARTVTFTTDAPSTQPLFVRLLVDDVERTVTIAARTTTATYDLVDAGTVAWDVPGWGTGRGQVTPPNVDSPPHASPAPAPEPAPAAEPAPVAPTFTG